MGEVANRQHFVKQGLRNVTSVCQASTSSEKRQSRIRASLNGYSGNVRSMQ